MDNRTSKTKLRIIPAIVFLLAYFAVGSNVYAQERKPNCELSVIVKAWNEAGGDLASGFVGVTDQGKVRSSRVAFIFAPRQGELRGSWGYEKFHSGTYLLYLDWEPPRRTKSGGFTESLLNHHFMTRWINVQEGEENVVRLELLDPGSGQLTVSPSLSSKHHSAWLLPLGGVGEDPPDITDDQQWRLAFKLNVNRSIDQKEATFGNLPFGSYRVFLVEQEQELEKVKRIRSCRILNSANVNVGRRERPSVEFGAKSEK